MNLRRISMAVVLLLLLSEHINSTAQEESHPAVAGFWLGVLAVGQQSLRIQLIIKGDLSGQLSCLVDSIDQGAFGIECRDVQFAGTNLTFDVPAVRGHWAGQLSSDNNELAGTWAQGANLPLNFTRQDRLIERPATPAATFQPAVPRVDAAGMKARLDLDLESALRSGRLSAQKGTGISIGVFTKGERRVFAYGTASPDSLFEIGSVTKTFTGLILAQLAVEHVIRLDQPVRELLPAGVVTKPAGPEITLLDLVTQHSGLPRIPDNMNPADPTNPYADYRPTDLYHYMGRAGVGKRPDATFLYSNLGFGLLGQALVHHTGMSYEQLLAKWVTQPLGLSNTFVELDPSKRARFIAGHGVTDKEVSSWSFDALAGAGAIRSTAGDLLDYLLANLHPENLKSRHSSSMRTGAAFTMSHQLRSDATPGMKIAFAWLYQDASGSYWHNGATGGYSSFVTFNPNEDLAVVVLVNRSIDSRGSLADLIGQHIGQRVAGEAAIRID